MKKKLNVWIFIGIACVFFSLSAASELIAMRLSVESAGIVVSFYRVILKLLTVFVFAISFFLTSLCIKNKKHAFWFLLLYAFAFYFPSLYGVFHGESPKFLYPIFTFLVVFIDSWYAIILYLGYDWFNKQKQTKELEKQNLQSELSLLKNQINPHFLFNTLNNIDSLIKKNPGHASKAIIDLSDIMRYMIYETNVDKVPLQKELDYIDNYLNLQKLQYFNNDLVECTITGDPKDKEIAPMLLIPFIENAFKHCTSKETKHAIRFSFLLESDKISFEARNISDKTRTISKDKSGGIGLETVRRRLEILYKNRYSLQIQEKNDLFCILLMIEIND